LKVLTYKEGSEIASKLLEAGASDVLSPPLSSEVVVSRIASIFSNVNNYREILLEFLLQPCSRLINRI
jgi:hypothetical protein